MDLDVIREELLDIIYPSACLGCGTTVAVVCSSCFASIAGKPLFGLGVADGPLRLRAPTALSDYRAACEHGGLAREMVLKLKSSARYLAAPLGLLMVAAGGNDPAYLVPDMVGFVPPERRKVAERGYNPAELLARVVARHLGRPIGDCLNKTRATLDQDHAAGDVRWSNVEGAFSVVPGREPRGSVVLVDDVLTTGATADACARALLSAGAREVRLLVSARAVLHAGRYRRVQYEE